MPGRGNSDHEVLIREALKRLSDEYGARLWRIIVEDTKLDITTSLDRGSFEKDRADRDFYPDILATTKTNKEKPDGRGKYAVKRRLLIECENGDNSTLITGAPSLRNYGYQMLKERYERRIRFILVTWTSYKDKIKNTLWDEIWLVPDKLKGTNRNNTETADATAVVSPTEETTDAQ